MTGSISAQSMCMCACQSLEKTLAHFVPCSLECRKVASTSHPSGNATSAATCMRSGLSRLKFASVRIIGLELPRPAV